MNPTTYEEYVEQARLLCNAWLHSQGIQLDLVDFYLQCCREGISTFADRIPHVRPVMVYAVMAQQAKDRIGSVMFHNILCCLSDPKRSAMSEIQIWLACTSFCLTAKSVYPDQHSSINSLLMELGSFIREKRQMPEEGLQAWLTAVFARCGLSITPDRQTP